MRKLILASAFALTGFAAAPAQAMPFPPAPDAEPGLTLIAQGCGPGWYRGPYGRCRPMGYWHPRPYYAPPLYAYRPPPYGYRPPPYAYRPHHCWWENGVRFCR